MRYLGLACDYDGTLASQGRVNARALAALDLWRTTGRKSILVTGRRLDDLLAIFPRPDLFDRIVAENGGVLYRPASREELLLADAPPAAFVKALHNSGVAPLEIGKTSVATWRPNECAAMAAVRDLGLDLQIVFNRAAVMILPAGVNKAAGLTAALKELDLSPHNVVGIGDAENDRSFLKMCECSAAVANAVAAIKDDVDFCTRGDYGDGVAELVEEVVATDLAAREETLGRHDLLFGACDNGAELKIRAYGENILIAGPSGSGKSSATASFIERLIEHQYQFCVIDPEGDYTTLDQAITVGDGVGAPSVDEIARILRDPSQNVAVNMLGTPLDERPAHFLRLLPRLQELRALYGRPHWIIIDEAHHLLPSSWQPSDLVMSQNLEGMAMITVHPDSVAPAFLSLVDCVVAIGNAPENTLRQYCAAMEETPPRLASLTLESGEAIFWRRRQRQAPQWIRLIPSRLERRRHRRKYAEGEVSRSRSFYFRGPEERLNLRAQNLILFMQLAEGLDDPTWLFHLRRGDYANWFRKVIKDERLAERALAVECTPHLSADRSRALIRSAIEEHYTLPA